MEKGSSQPWRDVLFQVTGESRLDGGALREYFRPLEDWLRNENLRTGKSFGFIFIPQFQLISRNFTFKKSILRFIHYWSSLVFYYKKNIIISFSVRRYKVFYLKSFHLSNFQNVTRYIPKNKFVSPILKKL